jgi:Sarcosine oxidase gamma subunit
LLNRYLPIDLRESKFQQASSASSAIHHVSIKLLKFSNNNYYLFIPRGFALSIWEILLESSKQFGYEILER